MTYVYAYLLRKKSVTPWLPKFLFKGGGVTYISIVSVHYLI